MLCLLYVAEDGNSLPHVLTEKQNEARETIGTDRNIKNYYNVLSLTLEKI